MSELVGIRFTGGPLDGTELQIFELDKFGGEWPPPEIVHDQSDPSGHYARVTFSALEKADPHIMRDADYTWIDFAPQ